MSTERELHPTFDPLEPIHNPVTQTPAPATEQPTVQYIETDGKTREEIVTAFATQVAKDGHSNALRNAARAILDQGKTATTVPITKYHDAPQLTAEGSVPVERAEVVEPAEKSPTEKFHDSEVAPESAKSEEEAVKAAEPAK